MSPQNQQLIIRLLENENQVVANALASTGGVRGVSSVIGEEYSEYYSLVLAKVADFAKGGNNSAVPAVSRGAYNSDSNVGDLLVDKWRVTLPLFTQLSQQGGLRQVRSLQMIGRILGSRREEIPPDQLELAESRLTTALNSSSTSVRIAAIRSSAEAGSTKGLEIIKRLAAQDNAQLGAGKQIRYPVREEATRALTKLQR